MVGSCRCLKENLDELRIERVCSDRVTSNPEVISPPVGLVPRNALLFTHIASTPQCRLIGSYCWLAQGRIDGYSLKWTGCPLGSDCTRSVHESNVFSALGLAFERKQVPRFVGKVSS